MTEGKSDNPGLLAEGFASILLADVASAMHRYENEKSQQARRDMIRALFAAIEGYIWLYREHVVDVAKSMSALTVEEESALSELDHRVSEQGKIVTQPRFLPTLSAFRLTTRIASRLNPALTISFDTGDWDRLRAAISVRNRITHPKRETDLSIGDDDLKIAQSAFYWVMDATLGAREATNEASRQHNAELRAILSGLEDGDPAIWAEYLAAKRD